MVAGLEPAPGQLAHGCSRLKPYQLGDTITAALTGPVHQLIADKPESACVMVLGAAVSVLPSAAPHDRSAAFVTAAR